MSSGVPTAAEKQHGGVIDGMSIWSAHA